MPLHVSMQRSSGVASCSGCVNSVSSSAPDPFDQSHRFGANRARKPIGSMHTGSDRTSKWKVPLLPNNLLNRSSLDSKQFHPPSKSTTKEKDVHLFFTASGQLVECTSRGCRPVLSSTTTQSSGKSDVLDDTAESYETALGEDPHNVQILYKYGKFLCENQNNYAKGKVLLQQALKIAPCNAEILAEYARLLWERENDRKKASEVYERAVEADPENCYVLASYASFLWKSEQSFGLCAHL
mmetsp:Transcript_7609/g.46921  ORF Transcript_7609/g.46921 Transcript_7609/m.46921 type:complete len:240 (-) Transcript_7609:858-1577(-)